MGGVFSSWIWIAAGTSYYLRDHGRLLLFIIIAILQNDPRSSGINDTITIAFGGD